MKFWEFRKTGLSIDLNKAPEPAKRLAASRSFPSYLLRYHLDLTPKLGLLPCTAELDGEFRSVNVNTQLGFIRKTLEHPYRGNPLTVIGVDDTETRAQVLAATIMLEAINQHFKDPKRYERLPLWYKVYGGYKDKLRDTVDTPQAPLFGMLILTNIAENSTREKLEKTRDLLHMFSHLPRIVVYAGGSPLQWAKEQLHIRPTRVVYLGNRRQHIERQL